METQVLLRKTGENTGDYFTWELGGDKNTRQQGMNNKISLKKP